MKYFIILFYKIKYLLRDIESKIFPKLDWYLNMGKRKSGQYAGRKMLYMPESGQWIESQIISGKPFMIARFGAIELMIWRLFTFHRGKEKKAMEQADLCAGIFPQDEENIWGVIKEYQQCSKHIDGLGIWHTEMETYYIRHYVPKDTVCFHIWALEPWFFEQPWSKSLKGKKVLIVHPFVKSIEQQYKKRKALYENEDIIPEFELITLKAIQSAGGVKDSRFGTWHEALEYMEMQIAEIEFDIAILGCGAYGLPLAARIKQMGKQAIHMGGATQLLFGIKGKRWENNYRYKDLINENFIYPNDEETPVLAGQVEGACYWK